MGAHRAAAGLVAAACLLVAGCEPIANVSRDAAERIGAARPVAAKVRERAAAFEDSIGDDAAARKAFAAELDARYRVRALDCAHGYTPSLFESEADVRSKLTDTDCFESRDGELYEWLGQRRLTSLLDAEALVDAEAEPRDTVAASFPPAIVTYADASPVAALASDAALEVLDLASGETLFKDKTPGSRARSLSLSPNGRLLAVAVDSGLVFRDAADGEILAELPEYQQITWLDASTAVIVKQSKAAADLWDLRSGQKLPLKGLNAIVARVVPLEEEGQFVVATYNALLKYEWSRAAGGVKATLLAERTGPPVAWNDALGARTSDGRRFVFASKDLMITDLDSLETTHAELPAFYVSGIGAMPAAEEVLVEAMLRNLNESRRYVYSLTDGSFAPVTDAELEKAPSRYALRPTYVPSLERIAIVNGATIRLLPDVQRGLRYGSQALVQMLDDEQRAAQEKMAAATAARLGYRSDTSVGGIPVMAGPVANAARDATIEGVGVYESSANTGAPGRPTPPGPVNVVVQKTAKPIVLVLASYSTVYWRLSIMPGAQVRAVLLASYEDSTVTGAGDVRVTNIGRTYAYEQGSAEFTRLQAEVVRWTGRSIETFQGRYRGNSFVVGGR